MAQPYLWLKALHIIAVISWMAGMLYLPRLYVYHADVTAGSEADTMLQTMEKRLLRFIMTPAMIMTFIFGGSLIGIVGMGALGGWFHLKLLLVLGLTALHGMLAKWRKDFVKGTNSHSTKFYRIINEVPTVAMIIIVILVVVKPF